MGLIFLWISIISRLETLAIRGLDNQLRLTFGKSSPEPLLNEQSHCITKLQMIIPHCPAATFHNCEIRSETVTLSELPQELLICELPMQPSKK